MKRCSRCGREKLLTEFTRNRRSRDGLQSFCNLCQRAAVRDHYYARRDYYLEKAARQGRVLDGKFRELKWGLKAVPCMRCGHSYPPQAMHFDHVRGEKVFNIGRGNRRPPSELLAELLKCDVYCANCHMDRTLRPRLVKADDWLARWPEEVLWAAP